MKQSANNNTTVVVFYIYSQTTIMMINTSIRQIDGLYSFPSLSVPTATVLTSGKNKNATVKSIIST